MAQAEERRPESSWARKSVARLPDVQLLFAQNRRGSLAAAPAAAAARRACERCDHRRFGDDFRAHACAYRPGAFQGGRGGDESQPDRPRLCFHDVKLPCAHRLRRAGAPSPEAENPLPANRDSLLHELCRLLHPWLPAHHRGGDPLLGLRAGRPDRRQHREPDGRRRHHLLAGPRPDRRDGLADLARSGVRHQSLPSACQRTDRAWRFSARSARISGGSPTWAGAAAR